MAGVAVVANLKGGSGKTTLAVNLAAALARHGPVVLVDADPQGSATSWAAAGSLAPVTMVEMVLPEAGERAVSDWLGRLVQLKAEATVVVDLPPTLGHAATAAMSLADLVLVPVTPSALDLRAAVRTLALLRQARTVRRNGKPAALLVPSRIDRRTGAGREIEAALSDFGEPVAPAISQRAAHADAAAAGSWIGAYAPRSAGHAEIEALAALVRRTLNRDQAPEPASSRSASSR